MASEAPTVIHRFVELALGADTALHSAVDCAGDTLNYVQLLALASALAREVVPESDTQKKPIVAIISENHPYTLAIILATWLVGGVVASLDVHAPEPLLRGMLDTVKPGVVIFPEGVELPGKICKGKQHVHFSYFCK